MLVNYVRLNFGISRSEHVGALYLTDIPFYNQVNQKQLVMEFNRSSLAGQMISNVDFHAYEFVENAIWMWLINWQLLLVYLKRFWWNLIHVYVL